MAFNPQLLFQLVQPDGSSSLAYSTAYLGTGLAFTAGASGQPGTITVAGEPSSGYTQGSVLFGGASGIVSQNNLALNWNDTTKLFTVNANAAALPAGPAGTLLQIGAADGTTPRVVIDGFGVANPNLTFRRSNGTAAAPSALLAGDQIGVVTAFGYGTTGYTSGSRGGLGISAAENWTDAAQGTFLRLFTTDIGSTNINERARLMRGLNIGGTTDPGAGNLALNSMTAGSIPFFAANGVVSQDNATFFWDNTNKRLGIGIATPGQKLVVDGSPGTPASSGTAQNGILRVGTSAGAFTNILDIGKSNVSPFGLWLQATDSNNLATTYPLVLQFNGGSVGIGNTVAPAKLSVGTTAATAQTFNTLTDASNYENAYMGDWGVTPNVATYGTGRSGTGSVREVQILVGGVESTRFGSGGILVNSASTTTHGIFDLFASGMADNNATQFYIGTAANTKTAGIVGYTHQATDTLSTLDFGIFGISPSMLSIRADNNVIISAMPTVNPHVVGALWNNGGVVNISAG